MIKHPTMFSPSHDWPLVLFGPCLCLKPFKPQILTQPQLRQLQPVLKGFAVFLACSWQSSWANVGVCGDVCMCIYIYIHMCEIWKHAFWIMLIHIGCSRRYGGINQTSLWGYNGRYAQLSHTHTYTRNYIWYCCAAQQYHDYGCMCVWVCERERDIPPK